jgi:hypothetical protein
MAFFNQSGLKPITRYSIFIIKVFSGISLTLIYTYYYSDRSTADIYKYYDDARVIASSLPQHPDIYLKLLMGLEENDPSLLPYINQMHNWSPHSDQWLNYTQTQDYNFFSSNRIITRFNALLWPFTAGNIYTHVLFMCFISMLGLVAFYRRICQDGTNKKGLLLVFLFLWPSLLLWCSGVLKDGLIVAAFYLGFYILTSSKASSNIAWKSGLLLLLTFLLLLTKYYVVVAVLPALLALLIYQLSGKINIFLSHAASFIVCTVVIVTSSTISTNANAISMLNDKREEALKAAILGNAQHTLFVHTADPGIVGFFKEIPAAILCGLFRPFIWESRNSPLIFLSALENALLFLLFIACLIYPEKRKNIPNWVWAMLSFSICLAFIIGYTSPVSGGIVRYKTAFLPGLIAAFIMLINWEKVPFPSKGKSILKQWNEKLFNS